MADMDKLCREHDRMEMGPSVTYRLQHIAYMNETEGRAAMSSSPAYMLILITEGYGKVMLRDESGARFHRGSCLLFAPGMVVTAEAGAEGMASALK